MSRFCRNWQLSYPFMFVCIGIMISISTIDMPSDKLKVAASFSCHVLMLHWCLQGYLKKNKEEQFHEQQKGLLARLAQLEAAAAAAKAAT